MPPCRNVWRSKIGSMDDGNSSKMFSTSTGFPNRTQFSNDLCSAWGNEPRPCNAPHTQQALRPDLMKRSSVTLSTSRLLSFSRFLIHLFAWPCGSMTSGQRRANDMMMAFSPDSASAQRVLKPVSKTAHRKKNASITHRKAARTTPRLASAQDRP